MFDARTTIVLHESPAFGSHTCDARPGFSVHDAALLHAPAVCGPHANPRSVESCPPFPFGSETTHLYEMVERSGWRGRELGRVRQRDVLREGRRCQRFGRRLHRQQAGAGERREVDGVLQRLLLVAETAQVDRERDRRQEHDHEERGQDRDDAFLRGRLPAQGPPPAQRQFPSKRDSADAVSWSLLPIPIIVGSGVMKL